MKRQGLPLRQIAEVLGRGERSIAYRLSKVGQGLRRFRAWSEDEDQKLLAMIEAGSSVEEIMKCLGRSYHGVVGRAYALTRHYPAGAQAAKYRKPEES